MSKGCRVNKVDSQGVGDEGLNPFLLEEGACIEKDKTLIVFKRIRKKEQWDLGKSLGAKERLMVFQKKELRPNADLV